MTPAEIRESIIVPVVEELGGGEAAVNLIYRTGLAESGYRVVEQAGGGPALGYWQCEPDTHQDIWNNFLSFRKTLRDEVRSFLPDRIATDACLRECHQYAAAICRVHYMRSPVPLPDADDIQGQAAYWKKWYNTPDGKGSVAHFIEAVEADE